MTDPNLIRRRVDELEDEGFSAVAGTYRVIAKTWEVLDCVGIRGSTFAFGKSFIRPSVVEDLSRLQEALENHPEAKVMIFAHADKVGSDSDNKAMSERRALSVYAFINNDVEVWETLYHQENWGFASTQEVMADLGHYQGPINGTESESMRHAIREFQTAHGLNATGSVDPTTRKALYAEYMSGKHDIVLAPDQFLTLPHMGCSEFNPLRNVERAFEPNRRVAFFLFDPERVPEFPCKAGDLGPCREMIAVAGTRHKPSFTCAFYDNIAAESPTEGGLLPESTEITNLHWEPLEAVCGDTVRLLGNTTLPDGTEVEAVLNPVRGESPLLTPITLRASGGRVQFDWPVANISFENVEDDDFYESIELDVNIVFNGAEAKSWDPLKVKALFRAEEIVFDAQHQWSGFTNHSHFKQKLDQFRNEVQVDFEVIKAWGAYWIDMSSAGITGLAGGNPWAGYRWGRSTGVNPMAPDQYYDGTAWLPLPDGFSLTPTNHSACGFYQRGNHYQLADQAGGNWPEAFADYDFNSAEYTQRRTDWTTNTHDVWTEQFDLRRRNCASDITNACCRYAVEVNVNFQVVTNWTSSVICFCPGELRSNAGIWFMDDPDIAMAAHESGHHLDNPDEYTGGAVDTTLNTDGAVNGICDDSIMGQNMTVVHKRHYHAFGDTLKRLVRNAYAKTYDFDVVDKV